MATKEIHIEKIQRAWFVRVVEDDGSERSFRFRCGIEALRFASEILENEKKDACVMRSSLYLE